MAKNLLSELDSDSNGTLSASELQTAIDQMSSANSGTSVASTEDVFASIDANEDGEVTETELSDTLQTLADSIGFAQGMGGMPPPPPPGLSGNDTGFTEEELTSQLASLNESGSLNEADMARAELLTNVLSQFETADANSDGNVTFQEAMALEQSSDNASTTTSETGATTAAQGMGGPGGPGGPGGMGGPPPAAADSETDSSQIIAAADTNEDGTVSLEELIAYNQSSQTSSTTTTDATSSATATASTDSTTSSASVMRTVMRLMQTYGSTDQTSQTRQMSGLLSLSA
jgi:Ca2+-binding EF-hand superfamily protein